jgi:hypothetical protein
MFTLMAAGLLLAVAGSAFAAEYPPGPGGTCPDTLTLFDVRFNDATCYPASGDTVYGVKGIVTGFDKDFSPFAFYVQVNGGPWRGAQVFTGATNYFGPVADSPTGGNLQLGDQVIVYGRRLEFNNFTELTDFDNSQATNDIVIRRGSPANVAVPAFHITNTDEVNWVPGLAPNAEQWEGMLVKIKGPLVVGRTVGTGVGSRTMLVSHASFPGDTAALDGFALSNVPALAVGTVIDSAQGILTQTIISGVGSYRIAMRSSADLFASAPPSLVDAFSVEDNLVRLTFDRDLNEASAENISHYSLSSFGTVNSATLDNSNPKIVVLNITNGLSDGDIEDVTAENVMSAAGLTMPAAQSRTFANGVMRLSAIQKPSTAGLGEAPCHDRTRFSTATGQNGTRISYRGTCVWASGSVYYLADETNHVDSLRAALPVFAPPLPMVEGRRYLVAGQVQEFDGISTQLAGGFTEGASVVYMVDEGPGVIPSPRVQTVAVLADSSCDATQSVRTGEDYEGMLVRVNYVRVAEERDSGESFFVAGPSPTFTDTILVTNLGTSYTFDPDSAHTVTVTGLLSFRNGNRPFRITPRDDADIVDHGLNVGVGDVPSTVQFSITNPSRSPRISFVLPKDENVELAVFDVSGRRVADIVRGGLPAGTYQKDWKAPNGSGMYFVRLRVGNQTYTKSAVVLN